MGSDSEPLCDAVGGAGAARFSNGFDALPPLLPVGDLTRGCLGAPHTIPLMMTPFRTSSRDTESVSVAGRFSLSLFDSVADGEGITGGCDCSGGQLLWRSSGMDFSTRLEVGLCGRAGEREFEPWYPPAGTLTHRLRGGNIKINMDSQ